MNDRTPLVPGDRRLRERSARFVSPAMASVILLAAACLVLVAEMNTEREPNWVTLASGKTVATLSPKGTKKADEATVAASDTDVHDEEPSAFSGITSFVRGLTKDMSKPAEKPMLNAPNVKVELYMESLCPGCQYFTSHVLFPVLKEPGMSKIIDLRIIPAGNAEMVKDPKTKADKVECQHGETECEGNKILACLQKQQDPVAVKLAGQDSAYLAAVDCIENHAPTELGSPFSGMANTTQGLYIIRNNAGICIKKHGIDLDGVLACAEGAEGQELLEKSVAETDSLKPEFEYAPWVIVDGKALKDDAYSLKERVCDAYKGVKPLECDPSQLKDYFPNQVLTAAEDAMHAMSAKASRQALNQYFDGLSKQQQKQHSLAMRGASGRHAAPLSKKMQTVQALSTAPAHALPFQYCDAEGNNRVMV